MLINRKEFVYYVGAGLFATAVDWTTFTIAVKLVNLHYQFALILALAMGSLAHYFANRIVTFKSRTQKYGSQVSIYILLVCFTVLMSMGIMSCLIKLLGINNIAARILTTGLMLLPNYLLHKYITFSKRFFAEPI